MRGLGFRGWSLGLRVEGFEIWDLGFGFWGWGVGFDVLMADFEDFFDAES